jgi:hypothetical protein
VSAVVTERPEWVKCALTGSLLEPPPDEADQRTWCGRTPEVAEWCFENANYAALNGAYGGRLVLCPNCCVRIVRALVRRGEEECEVPA